MSMVKWTKEDSDKLRLIEMEIHLQKFHNKSIQEEKEFRKLKKDLK